MTRRAALQVKEVPASTYIPYTCHITPNVIKTTGGDYLTILKLDGVSYQTADDEDINAWLESLSGMLLNIATPQISINSYVARREDFTYPDGDFEPGFAREFNDRYKAKVCNGSMLVNELYLSILYRPDKIKLGILDKLKKHSKEEIAEINETAVNRLEQFTSNIFSSLDKYSPRRLGFYKNINGTLFSEALEFLSYLLNGHWKRVAVPRGLISNALATSRPLFGGESFEMRMPDKSRVGAILSIKEYAEQTEPGYINELLTVPWTFVLCQSFNFISRPTATAQLVRQIRRMESSGDFAESQIEAMKDALDDITSGRIAMGHHHLSLCVWSDTYGSGSAANAVRQLESRIAPACEILSESGMQVAREDIAIESAFWAQLPGNLQHRTRPAQISSANFACFSSFHNAPSGRPKNVWGPAITMLRTENDSPYLLNLHLSTTSATELPLGHFMFLGKSGTGKTTLLAAIVTWLQKYKPRLVMLDKDCGLKILILALRGKYFPLRNGYPTGFNPFQLDPTPENLVFLEKLIKGICYRPNKPFSVREEEDISKAIKGVLTLSKPARRISALLSFLDMTDPEGIAARLKRWCWYEGEQGPLTWVFDNPVDTLSFDNCRLFGFDVTAFLDNDEVRPAIVSYILHRTDELIDGSPFGIIIDEFWKPLSDKPLENFAKDKIKTIRKLNGIVGLCSQEVGDALNSPISSTLISQMATLLLLPNDKAEEKDYVDGLKVSQAEYNIVKTLPEKSRKFLIKQSTSSAVCALDLGGLDEDISVLSSNRDSVALVDRIIEEVGDDPDVWLPIFIEKRKYI